MRLHQKKQCIETIRLLEEAHGEIVRYVEKKQAEKASALLEQCQQGAISIGTLIEDAQGEGTETVRNLEEYSEIVYQLHEKILSGADSNVRQAQKKMRKLLLKAEAGIQQDIPTQTEAVFLPYKASMWDSLESVWRAAQEDPDCTALVVPIPYYDKNPDGSFGELHYETDLFPADVPVVPYDAYDFGARHPDMIFIHNPYDNGNYVTSVHPFFYSKNLKRYTDKLVYIPYFVLGEIDPSNEMAIKGMEHFCTTVGVVNADYVVVQSEAMRQVYIDVLVKYTGEDRRAYWQKKILGLGSPKVDKVCSLKREDFELPDEWRRLLQKEDGGRKKVVFYNTGVGTLLSSGEALLEKMERVFQIFWENRADVTLWWRPHPLMRATIASMRPQLLERYEQIEREYKAAGWGIYDDSADMDRAIALSDAYYGDMSSIVWLYQKTGKPIMIQKIGV